MTFNFPKDLIYKEAYKLQVFFEEALIFFQPLLLEYDYRELQLKKNDFSTLKEDFKNYIDMYCYNLIIDFEIKVSNISRGLILKLYLFDRNKISLKEIQIPKY